MLKNRYYVSALAGLLVLLLAAPSWVFAQNAGADKTFRQEELDQMLAPVALYPDPLLAQILVAATYPTQVTEADRWVRENADLKGDALNNALDGMDWDLSVKALVPFPQVLSMMDDKLSWTDRLGEAFLAQQADVMDTIQKLRSRAQAAGNLKSTPEQTVLVKGDSIEIAPANPEMVYVPYYDPAAIYGAWWYPAYPPYAWYPFGGPVISYGLFGFAAGFAVASAWNWGWGHWDWGHRSMDINITRNININRDHIGAVRTSSWNHEMHERGLTSSRNTGMRDADRNLGRPSTANVEKGLHEHNGTMQSSQGSLHSGQEKIDHNATLGKSATGSSGDGTAHGSNNFSPRENSLSNTGAPHNGNFSRGGVALSHGNGVARGGSFNNRAGFASGGNHGSVGMAHGGGSGHACGSKHC